MKYFIYGCLAAGGVLLLVAVSLFVPHYEYVVDGVWSTGTVIGFEEQVVVRKYRRGPSVRVTHYYPIIEYSFRGETYTVVMNTYQLDRSGPPYGLGRSGRVLVLPRNPGSAFVGTIPQLILPSIGVGVVGVAVLLVGAYFAYMSWRSGELTPRPEAAPFQWAGPATGW